MKILTRKSLRSFALLNMAAFGGLHLINKGIKKHASSSNLLREYPGSFYDWKYGKVFYKVTGKGHEPLLLIHSASEILSGFEWNSVVGRLGRRYRIYTIDLPGCGRSDKPALEYTNYFFVSLIQSFLRDVVGEPAVIAASRFSSSFAVMAAAAEPDLISRVILINPPSLKKLSGVPDRQSRFLRGLLSFPVIGEAIYNIITSKAGINSALSGKIVTAMHGYGRLGALCYESAHLGRGSGRFLRASRDGGIMNWNINRALSVISQDVVIIYAAEHEENAKICASYRKLCPGLKSFPVTSSLTLPHCENPEEFCRILLSL